jgi:hypothetical protein
MFQQAVAGGDVEVILQLCVGKETMRRGEIKEENDLRW